MSKLDEIINLLKKNRGIKTDAELGEILNLTRQNVWNGKNKGKFSDEQCVIIARCAGIHPGLVIAARELQKEKNKNVIDVWEDIFSACTDKFSTDNRHYRKLGIFTTFYLKSMCYRLLSGFTPDDTQLFKLVSKSLRLTKTYFSPRSFAIA